MIGWSKLVSPKAARTSGNTTTSAIASRRPGDGADGEKQRHHIEPDDAALLLLVVDDVERVEDRLHAGIGAPQRDAEPEEEAEGQPAVALRGDARDLVAQHDRASRPARCRRRSRDACRCRPHWRTARRTKRRRRSPETRPPANRRRRRRRAPAAGRPGFRDRCARGCPSSRARESAMAPRRCGRGRARRRGFAAGQRLLRRRRARRQARRRRLAAVVLDLEGIDDAGRHHTEAANQEIRSSDECGRGRSMGRFMRCYRKGEATGPDQRSAAASVSCTIWRIGRGELAC